VKIILLEAMVISAVGAAVALAANHFSPRGLVLTRNYFPESSVGAAVSKPAPANDSGTIAASAPDLVKARVQEAGLQLANADDVLRLFRDPRREQDLVVFLDARSDDHYREGHIPGAYLLDYYRAEKYLGDILPVCQKAEKIVVYCNGGDCEDSLHTAMLLGNDAGVSKEKLCVYGGGIAEWTAEGQPVETGERNSGNLTKPAK
jgi:rhodanese-related sulfurtransferase